MEDFARVVLRSMSHSLEAEVAHGIEQGYRVGLVQGGIDAAAAQQMVNPEVLRGFAVRSPVWQQYGGLTEELGQQVNASIMRAHLAHGGFDPKQLAKELSTSFGFAKWRSRTIARTETQALHVAGREQAWRQLDPQGRWRYTWGGPYDRRTSEACRWVGDQVPAGGLVLEELATLVERARLKFYPRLTSRRFQVHPNERHEPRKVRAVLPDEAEEEIPYFQRFRPESPGPIPAKVP